MELNPEMLPRVKFSIFMSKQSFLKHENFQRRWSERSDLGAHGSFSSRFYTKANKVFEFMSGQKLIFRKSGKYKKFIDARMAQQPTVTSLNCYADF